MNVIYVTYVKYRGFCLMYLSTSAKICIKSFILDFVLFPHVTKQSYSKFINYKNSEIMTYFQICVFIRFLQVSILQSLIKFNFKLFIAINTVNFTNKTSPIEIFLTVVQAYHILFVNNVKQTFKRLVSH